MKLIFSLSIWFLALLNVPLYAQDSIAANPSDASIHTGFSKANPDKKKLLLLTAANTAFYTGSFILLNEAWYKNFPKTSFHVFNDSQEWLQMDKVGHAWTSYNISKGSFELWKSTGISHEKAALLGGFNGVAYLTVIELLDAHSAEWGWSWSDVAANVVGSGLFSTQEMLWKEQRLQFKFSFHSVNYNNPTLQNRANDLYGSSWYERMLKDYNGQSYWLSANLHSFLPESKLPKWLNLAVGYGADGMFGGFSNIARDDRGNIVFNRSDIPRVRQFYLAPDIDLTRIPTNKKWLKTAFYLLNTFKIPAPALMLDSRGKMKLHGWYY